jgi:hypothetical protein
MAKKPPEYPGDLNEPLPKLEDLLSGRFEEAQRHRMDEMWRRLFLLFDHFEIDRTDPHRWGRLAICLAQKHVPGFQDAKPKPGREKEWDFENDWRLFNDVRELMAKQPSISNACRILSNQPRYKLMSQKTTEGNLRKRFYIINTQMELHERFINEILSLKENDAD